MHDKKRCPKCRGTLVLDREDDICYCLNCGYRDYNLQSQTPAPAKTKVLLKEKSQKKSGGQVVLEKYGSGHFRDIGRMGGRPRALTMEQIKTSTASKAEIKIKRKGERHGEGESLKELKRLWKERQLRMGQKPEPVCLVRDIDSR